MKKLNIIFEDGGYEWGYKAIFRGFKNYCLQNVKDIEFNCVCSTSLRNTAGVTYRGCGEKYGPMYLMVENPDTKKYILVSYWDKLYDVINMFDLDNCVAVYSSAGGHTNDIDCKALNFNYIPISYVSTLVSHEAYIEEALATITPSKIQEKLLFRGYLYLFREYLSRDDRFNVTSEKIEFKDYICDARSNYCNFNLNGAAELNQRDMELLGTGTAMLRPKLVTKFHKPLIPDHHYISVDYDDLQDGDMFSFYKKFSDRILERYNSVKDNIDYLKFVGDNAREWYLENGTISANVKILSKLVDFNKLF
jgi:hypothetical protein